jgi:hypothetical protein
VIIAQGRAGLSQRQVQVPEYNVFRSHSRFVPTHDSADGQTSAGKFRPSTADFWVRGRSKFRSP